MKYYNIIMLILLFFLIIPLTSSYICQDTTTIDNIPCVAVTPVLTCSTNATITNLSSAVSYNQTIFSRGDGTYNFTFNYSLGSYSILLCDNTTATINVVSSTNITANSICGVSSSVMRINSTTIQFGASSWNSTGSKTNYTLTGNCLDDSNQPIIFPTFNINGTGTYSSFYSSTKGGNCEIGVLNQACSSSNVLWTSFYNNTGLTTDQNNTINWINLTVNNISSTISSINSTVNSILTSTQQLNSSLNAINLSIQTVISLLNNQSLNLTSINSLLNTINNNTNKNSYSISTGTIYYNNDNLTIAIAISNSTGQKLSGQTIYADIYYPNQTVFISAQLLTEIGSTGLYTFTRNLSTNMSTGVYLTNFYNSNLNMVGSFQISSASSSGSTTINNVINSGGGGSIVYYSSSSSGSDVYLCNKVYDFINLYGKDNTKYEKLLADLSNSTGKTYDILLIDYYVQNWQKVCSDVTGKSLNEPFLCQSIKDYNNGEQTISLTDLNTLRQKMEPILVVSNDLLAKYINQYPYRCQGVVSTPNVVNWVKWTFWIIIGLILIVFLSILFYNKVLYTYLRRNKRLKNQESKRVWELPHS